MDSGDLIPMYEHFAGLLPDALPLIPEQQVSVTAITVESPIELDVLTQSAGQLELNSSPPLYYIDTTYDASPHRMRITIAVEQD